MRFGYEDQELEIYDELPEMMEDEDVLLSDVADEYGEAEAAYLIDEGVVLDQRDSTIRMRESRFPEADHEFKQFYDTDSILKPAGKAAAKAALPIGTGAMAVQTGGDPGWVGMTGVTSYIIRNSFSRSLDDIQTEIGKRRNLTRKARDYRLEDVAYEDFEFDSMGDEDFVEWIKDQNLDDDMLEIRESPGVNIVAAVPMGMNIEGSSGPR